MGDNALRKWAAARTVHEVWDVPFDLLQQLLVLTDGRIENRARTEGWVSNQSAQSLKARLVQVIDDQLTRLLGTEGVADDEKRARALSTIAKALESIASTDVKLKNSQGKTTDQQNGGPNDPVSNDGANRTEELDRQLTKLIEGLAAQ